MRLTTRVVLCWNICWMDETKENMYKVISEEKTEKKHNIWDDYEWDGEEESESADSERIWLWWGSPLPSEYVTSCSSTSLTKKILFRLSVFSPILHIWLDSWFIVKHFRANVKHNEKSKESSSHESDRRASIEFQEAKIIMPKPTGEDDVKNDTFSFLLNETKVETTSIWLRKKKDENYLQINKH